MEIVDSPDKDFSTYGWDGEFIDDCDLYRTKDSVIGLCYEETSHVNEWYKGRAMSLNCKINSSEKILKNISLEIDEKGNFTGSDGSLTTINFHYTELTIPSIDYLIDNQGNLVVEIKGDKILEISTELSDHDNARRYSGAYDHHEERWARGILEDNPDAVIKFKFIRKIF